jgi:hypothetical protein
MRAGSDGQAAVLESFNSKLRDGLLNGEIFYTLHEASVVIEGCGHRTPTFITRLQTTGSRGTAIAGFATRPFAGGGCPTPPHGG